MANLRLVLILLSIVFGLPENHAHPARVQISRDRSRFEVAETESFTPVGVTYFRADTGWAPQVWKQWDAAKAREDFDRIRSLGINTVRVFLSYGSFRTVKGAVDESGLKKFDEFLVLAEEYGVRVQPTGLDFWEGRPSWLADPDLDRFADEQLIADEEEFWDTFAARYANRSVIFAYELLNEPSIRWTSPAMTRKWREWCRARYGDIAALKEAWGPNFQEESFDNLSVPKPRSAPRDRRLLDYQHFREDLASAWTKRMSAAIKAADPAALVTVGLVQWSVPMHISAPLRYSAFNPRKLRPWIDFQSLHFYPFAWGFYEYQSSEAEANNLSYLAALVRELRETGVPVVIGEFGWYGGGDPTFDEGLRLAASEADQAAWGQAVIDETKPDVAGWMTWALYDVPKAKDPTELSGLHKSTGERKSWGEYFASVSSTLKASQPRQEIRYRDYRAFDWDEALTDPEKGEKFRSEFHGFWKSLR